MIEILPNPEGGTLSRVRRPEHETEVRRLDLLFSLHLSSVVQPLFWSGQVSVTFH